MWYAFSSGFFAIAGVVAGAPTTAGGMLSWTPDQWGLFLAAVVGAVLTAYKAIVRERAERRRRKRRKTRKLKTRTDRRAEENGADDPID